MADEMTKTYIEILVETLRKKVRILEELERHTKHQEELLGEEDFDEALFDEIIEEKAQLILEAGDCDDGFERIYPRVKAEFEQRKYDFQSEIEVLQGLIQKTMALGASIETLENQNKIRFQMQITGKRQRIRNYKQSSQVAASYYKNMANQHQMGNSYFMDKKK